MEYKKSMIIIILAIFLLSIASVCASDANDTAIASEDTTAIELSQNEEITTTDESQKTIQTNDTEMLTASDEETTVAQNNLDTLSLEEKTYADLSNAVGSGGNINLQPAYYKYNGESDTITITHPGIINGNGAIIDMAGSTIRAFNVYAAGVTIKNLTIKNTKYNGDGGAIYFAQSGSVINCNFNDNKATGSTSYGGAVYFKSTGNVSNCNFTGNTAAYGGAVWMNSGTVSNCNFINNSATGEDSLGGAIVMYSGSVSNCNFTNNHASYAGAVYFYQGTGSVTNCNFTNNTATYQGGAIRFSDTGNVTNCNFTGNTASGDGGAIWMYSGSVENCNFTNNTATYQGGAIFSWNWYTAADTCIFKRNSGENVNVVIYPPTLNVDNFTTFYGSGEKLTFNLTTDSGVPVNNGNISISVYFKDNNSWVRNYSCLSGEGWSVDLSVGSYYAIYNTEYAEFKAINRTITITPPNYTFWALNHTINDNDASEINLTNDYYYDPAYDEAFANGIVINRKVIINGNSHTIDAKGKARVFNVQADDVTIENLTIKNANYNGDGGAVYFAKSGRAINCNFTNNQASVNGGAVYFYGTGSVTNCNFTNNTATYGGAVYFYGTGSVTNCNFTNNTATYGGAVYFFNTGTVTNCNFTNNQDSVNGGAVYFRNTGNVTNCNFTGNTASGNGGAIRISSGTVTNCNFTGNNATTGSSIFFNSYGNAKTISNSIFLNNLANAESLEIIKNDNNITITFKGKDNLLNAIYSPDDVNFANVTYWGANGIANTDSSTPSRSKNEAGQNITVGIVVNDKLVLDNVYVTDENGMIVLDISAGDNYYISVRHDADSYYTEAERTITNNTKFNVNVTSQTTTNKTVNITAKSNILNEVMPGKLLFILPNNIEINATYASNGTWWAVHAFDDYKDYQVNASYIGLDNVTVTNATISISKANSTVEVSDVVLTYGESKEVTVTTTGATGITAKIDNDPVSVIDNYTIRISGLNAGNYTLTVTTIPDGDHDPATKTVNITVNKAGTKITLINETLYLKAGDMVSDLANLTPGGAGNLTFQSSNEDIAIAYEGTIWARVKGNVTVTVSFAGNDNYAPAANKTITVYITPKDASVSVENETLNLNVDDKYEFNPTVNPSFLAVEYSSSNESVVTVTDYGLVRAVGEGTAIITLTVGNNQAYAINTTNVTVTVSLNDASVSVNNSTLDLFVGDAFTVVATTVPDGLNVTYLPDNSGVVSVDENGVVTALKEGTATILVKVGGDGIYVENSTEITVTVSKIATEINLTNKTIELKAHKSIGDLATLTPAWAGNLTYTSNDEDIVLVSEDGIIYALIKGTATVTVSFVGDNKYKAAENKTITVNVTLNDASVSTENDTIDLNVDDTFIINATADPRFLTVYYTSSNETVATVTEYGNLKAVGEGTAIITLTVGNGETYAVNSTYVTVTVSKIPTEITVDTTPLDLFVGDEIVIVDNLTPAGAGNVTFTSSDYDVVDFDFEGNVIAQGKGQAIITVSFAGDDKYAAAENKTIIINVSLDNASVTVDNNTLDLKVGETSAINATKHPDTIMLDITYTSSNNSVATVDKNGIVTAVGEGTAVITVEVGDDEIYAKNSTNVTVTVSKVPTEIASDPVTATYNVDEDLIITLKDSNGTPLGGENISVDLNGAKTYATDNNGQVKVSTAGLTPGVYALRITFSGTAVYEKSANEVSVTINKATPKITAKSKTFKTTAKTKKYAITLKDNTGNPIKKATVYLKVAGKKYKAVTNSKGKATFNLKKLTKKGKYSAVITYKGSNFYNKATKKVKITVKTAFKTVSKGSKDSKMVKKIQRALKNNGYYLSYNGHYMKVDGIFEGYTKMAVKDFQRDHGFKATGKVDEKTAKKLKIIK